MARPNIPREYQGYPFHSTSFSERPFVQRRIQEMTARLGLDTPTSFYLVEHSGIGLLTLRGRHQVIITRGMYELLTDRELVGAIAHELIHVKEAFLLTASEATPRVAGGMAGIYASRLADNRTQQKAEANGTTPNSAGMLTRRVLFTGGGMAAVDYFTTPPIKRFFERRADRGAIELSGAPEACASMMQKFLKLENGQGPGRFHPSALSRLREAERHIGRDSGRS